MYNGTDLRLRALEPTDLELLYIWENDPEIWLISGTLVPFSRFVLQQYLSNAHLDIYTSKQLRLMIELTINNSIISIGCVDLFDFDPKNKRAGIGILIAEQAHRNKGYASQALNLISKYAFDTLDLHQLYCNITVDNKHSLSLFQKHNFQITGLKHHWIFNNGKWIDEYLLQSLKKSQ